MLKKNEKHKVKVSQSLRKTVTALKFLKIKNKDLFWEKIDEIASKIQPKSKVFQHKWLFDNKFIDWTLLVERDIETRPSIQEHTNLLKTRRIQAVDEILSDAGEDAVIDLLMNVSYPSIVSQSLLHTETVTERRVYWIEKVLEISCERAAEGFIKQTLLDTNKEGYEIAQIVDQLKNYGVFENEGKRNLFVRSLPTESKGWKILKKFDSKAEKIYWESFDIEKFLEFKVVEIRFVVKKLVQFNRSVEVFKIAAPYYDEIESSMWKKVLKSIACPEVLNNLDYDYVYYLNDIFKCLDEDQNNSVKEIAELEFPFLSDFSAAERLLEDRKLANHQLISDDINYFIDLLSLCHKSDEGVMNPNSVGISNKDTNNDRESANQILTSWSRVPGENDNGLIDQEQFEEWINEAYKKAKESALLNALKYYLPRIFAKFACKIPWELTLPDVILEVLNQDEDSSLRDKFWMEIVNFSGVFLGDLFVGGLRQRELAEKYKMLASRIKPNYPRVAESLKIGANQLVKEAEYEDDRFKLRGR